ncbi:MAG: hypothetical protein AAGH70_14335 [Pseudomonadota bacterium]
MFGVKNAYKKAEAAAIIETILESPEIARLSPHSPKLKANEIIQNCWARGSHLLNGSQAPRPSRFAFAAVALSDAVKFDRGTVDDKLYLMLSIRTLLDGVAEVPDKAVKSRLDEKLFNIADDALATFFDGQE